MNEDMELVGGLPFDHFERYRVTAEILDIVSGGRTLRLLDVGGHFSSLKLLRPQDSVVLADPKPRPPHAYRPSVPFRSDHYVMALGGRLPFRDQTFDVVTAHDTLEHVPPGQREGFLDDMVRLARRFLVLNGPVVSPEAEEAERRTARLWSEGLGLDRHPLDEHLENGLPPAQELAAALDRRGLAHVAIPNGSISVWEAMMALKIYLQGLPDSESADQALDRAFNLLLAPRDFGGTCYRVALVAGTARETDALQRVREAFAARIEQPPLLEGSGHLTALSDALREHIRLLRKNLAEIAVLRAALDDARGHVDRLNALLRETDRRLQEKDRALQAELRRAAEERARTEAEPQAAQTSRRSPRLGRIRRGNADPGRDRG